MKRFASFAFAIVAASRPALADYQQTYRAGVTAYSRSAWEQTITAMRQAIRDHPAESADTVFIYGTWYEPYVPYYYLGMALYKSGHCADAIEPLEKTQQQNVLSRKYASNVTQALRDCAESRPSRPSTPPPHPGNVPVPVIVTNTVAPAPEPTATVAKSTASAPAVREGAVQISRSAGSALSPTPQTPTLVAPVPRVDDRRELLAAVDAYLRGDYAQSLNVLDRTAFTDSRSRQQAVLFRAAALHGLYLLSDGNSELRNRAAAQVHLYKQMKPERALDARVFSPAFQEFVRAH